MWLTIACGGAIAESDCATTASNLGEYGLVLRGAVVLEVARLNQDFFLNWSLEFLDAGRSSPSPQDPYPTAEAKFVHEAGFAIGSRFEWFYQQMTANIHEIAWGRRQHAC